MKLIGPLGAFLVPALWNWKAYIRPAYEQRIHDFPIIDYDNHPGYQSARPNQQSGSSAADIIMPAIEAKHKLLSENLNVYQRRTLKLSNRLARQFREMGALPLRISDRSIEDLRVVASSAEAKVRAQIASKRRSRLRFRDTQCVIHHDDVPAENYTALAHFLRRCLTETKAFELASAYYGGCRVELGRSVLRINVENQPFCENVFEDPSVPTPSTAGIHIDSNARPYINGTIYLNDVGPFQGPFEMVIGSNHWPFDLLDRAIRKTMDDRLVRGESHKLFMELPPNLRRKANFGFDVQDGSRESQLMLADLDRFDSEKCNLVLFDPEGAHRGGMVTRGERISIIFGLRILPP